jgi:uroporphyrinogen-III synthase
LLIVRPQPGASETAARADAIGLEPVVAPLFVAQPLPWNPPPADGLDAVMLTSAQAARLAGPRIAAYARLPCYAVGESTAAAARSVGFADVRCGDADGQALLALAAREGVSRLLHLCGRNRRSYEQAGIAIARVRVYAVDGVPALPQAAAEALRAGCVTLLHSPRAAAHFGTLCEAEGVDRSGVALAAISPAAAEAAGSGWETLAVAQRPRDEPLLELAAKLCKTAGR